MCADTNLSSKMFLEICLKIKQYLGILADILKGHHYGTIFLLIIVMIKAYKSIFAFLFWVQGYRFIIIRFIIIRLSVFCLNSTIIFELKRQSGDITDVVSIFVTIIKFHAFWWSNQFAVFCNFCWNIDWEICVVN